MAKRPAPLSEQHITNVASTLLAATAAERAGGVFWYETYHHLVVEYGRARGSTDGQSPAVFAVLSQQTPPSWASRARP